MLASASAAAAIRPVIREVLQLPDSNDGFIADTPGFYY